MLGVELQVKLTGEPGQAALKPKAPAASVVSTHIWLRSPGRSESTWIQPKSMPAVPRLVTEVRCVAIGKSVSLAKVWKLPDSSSSVEPSRSGKDAGRTPQVENETNSSGSRQTIRSAPPPKAPPLRKRWFQR